MLAVFALLALAAMAFSGKIPDEAMPLVLVAGLAIFAAKFVNFIAETEAESVKDIKKCPPHKWQDAASGLVCGLCGMTPNYIGRGDGDGQSKT